jgi:hypothetical protein
MDVIGFLCVSLGSSTVQLHDYLGSGSACECSEAGFSSQNGDRDWGVCCLRAASCCASFLWAKGLNGKDIHKDMFPLYGGSVCRVKRSQLGGRHFAYDEEVETEVRKWLRQDSKTSMLRVSTHLYSDGTSVSMLVDGMSRNKIISTFEYPMFYVLYQFVTSLLTFPRAYITSLF